MPRKNTADEPEQPDAQAEEPIEIVDLDTAVAAEALTPTEAQAGVSFWFGNGPDFIKFADGTSFHAKKNRCFVTDATIIANLKAAAEKPSNRITVET